MSQDALNAALALLPKLTRAEREILLARVSLLNTGLAQSTALAPQELSQALTIVAPGTFPPLARLERLPQYKRFARGADALAAFVTRLAPSLTRVERQRVYFVVLRCTIDEMRAQHVTVGPTSLGDKLLHVEEVLERAFPGYLQAGLLAQAIFFQGRD